MERAGGDGSYQFEMPNLNINCKMERRLPVDSATTCIMLDQRPSNN